MELGDWVAWEFQNEDEEAPRSSENREEVVPHPPLDRISPACLGLEGGGLEGRPGSQSSTTAGQGLQQTTLVADTKMQVFTTRLLPASLLFVYRFAAVLHDSPAA